MPDLNLKVIGRLDLWIELKAGTSHFELRPAQFAWAKRRIACGGRVIGLNRYKPRDEKIPYWQLYDFSRCLFEPMATHVRITNEPHAVGTTIEHLDACLHAL